MDSESQGRQGHHDERDCPFRTANTAIGFLSVAGAAAAAVAERPMLEKFEQTRRTPKIPGISPSALPD